MSRHIWREEEEAQGSESPGARPFQLWRDDEGSLEESAARVSSGGIEWGEGESSSTLISSVPSEAAAETREHISWDEFEGEADGRLTDNGAERSRAGDLSSPELEPEEPRGHHRSRKSRRVASLVLGLLVIGLLADGAYVAARIVSTAPTAADGLRNGMEHFRQGQLEAADGEFAAAARGASVAVDATGHPAYRVLTYLPWTRPDARAVESVMKAAELTGHAGRAGVDAALAMGIEDGDFLQGLYRDGRFDLPTLAAGRPYVESASGFLAQAETLLSSAPTPSLRLIGEALTTARSEIVSASTSARRGSEMFNALPSLLGGEGTRRYLLAFQATGEARGTGGVIGLHGVLVARDGALRLSEISSVHGTLGGIRQPVSVPDWMDAAYGAQFVARQWQQANLSPNFPAAAEILLEMYEDRTGRELDGVLAMDPIALEGFTRLTGPIESEGEALEGAELRRSMLEDQYLRFDSDEEQETYLSGFVESFWEKVRAGDLESTLLPDVLGAVSRSGHLKAYVRDQDAQKSLATLGAHGWIDDSEDNAQMVFHNNYGVNKLDIYLRRRLSTTVDINPDGSAQVTTRVRLRNRASDAPPSLLLGDGSAVPVGTNRMIFHTILPRGAEPESLRVGTQDRRPLTFMEENERPVVWDSVEMAAGGKRDIELIYTIPRAVQFTEQRGEFFQMTLFPQALARPDRFSFEVHAPQGYRLEGAEAFDESSEDGALAQGELNEPRTFVVRLRPR